MARCRLALLAGAVACRGLLPAAGAGSRVHRVASRSLQRRLRIELCDTGVRTGSVECPGPNPSLSGVTVTIFDAQVILSLSLLLLSRLRSRLSGAFSRPPIQFARRRSPSVPSRASGPTRGSGLRSDARLSLSQRLLLSADASTSPLHAHQAPPRTHATTHTAARPPHLSTSASLHHVYLLRAWRPRWIACILVALAAALGSSMR